MTNKKFSLLFLGTTIFLIIPMLTSCTSLRAGSQLSRQEQVDRYMEEFVSGDIRSGYPQIAKGIENALLKLPQDVFEKVSNRKSPIIFLNTITSGIARYANATQFRLEKGDPPTFGDGFYVIMLGDELNNALDIEAIEGVVAHEIAHDYLGHLNQPLQNCRMEKEANRTIQAWGFEDEYEKASEIFGAKKRGDSPCYDQEVLDQENPTQ